MTFLAWLDAWLARHPIKEPPRNPYYTLEVMRRVRVLAKSSAKSPSLTFALQWWSWPRLAFATVTAAVGIALFIVSTSISNRQLYQNIGRELQLLAAVAPDELGVVSVNDVNALAQDLETVDTLVLAEAHRSEDRWLEQTLQLFDQLDDDGAKVCAPSNDETSDEEWFKELQLLDESDLATI